MPLLQIGTLKTLTDRLDYLKIVALHQRHSAALSFALPAQQSWSACKLPRHPNCDLACS